MSPTFTGRRNEELFSDNILGEDTWVVGDEDEEVVEEIKVELCELTGIVLSSWKEGIKDRLTEENNFTSLSSLWTAAVSL